MFDIRQKKQCEFYLALTCYLATQQDLSVLQNVRKWEWACFPLIFPARERVESEVIASVLIHTYAWIHRCQRGLHCIPWGNSADPLPCPREKPQPLLWINSDLHQWYHWYKSAVIGVSKSHQEGRWDTAPLPLIPAPPDSYPPTPALL